jgi:two-component system response regulator YesN
MNKYSILIVDDEYLVRRGLAETVDWASINARVVGEASDGEEGLSLVEKLNPDLIISDVRMPILDGIGFVKKLKEKEFEGKIIVLSGYRDFDYAKQSFENGVYAYVLKPIDNSDILSAAKEAVTALESERKEKELYDGLKENMPLLSEKVVSAIVKGEGQDANPIKERLALFGLPDIKEGFLVLASVDALAKNPKGDLALLRKSLPAFLSEAPSWIAEIEGRIAFVTGLREVTTLKKDMEMVLKDFSSQSSDTVSISFASFLSVSSLPNCHEIAKVGLQKKLLVGLNTIVDADHVPNYSKNVIAAMGVISRRYMEDLTIKMASEELLVSESYLMHLFKDNLGQTFNDMLTSYRIMVAKNLLEGGRYRVKEVASMVGYRDVKYFSSVFSKTVGETPSNYGKGDGSGK